MNDDEAVPVQKTVPVESLRQGDLIDLEGDRYADPDFESIELEFEYARVESIHIEAKVIGHLVLVETTSGAFAFPAGHRVPRVWRDQ